MHIINLFGTGIRHFTCALPKNAFAAMDDFRQRKQLSWESILLDLHTLSEFGYGSFDELPIEHEGKGLLIAGQNYIEFRRNGRRFRKIAAMEFNDPYALLDPYNRENDTTTLTEEDGVQRISVIQLETGLIGKYGFESEEFFIDHITFAFNYQPLKKHFREEWISGLIHKGTPLELLCDDSVVMSQQVVVL